MFTLITHGMLHSRPKYVNLLELQLILVHYHIILGTAVNLAPAKLKHFL